MTSDERPTTDERPHVRICLIYDCLFPYTVGGAERWYRNLGERLAAGGHDVTMLTLRQWESGEEPDVPGVRVVAVGPRFKLYTDSGRRRVLPPIVFGAGVLWELLRRGRYDVVHTASFPYFSLLAAAAVRPLKGFRLVVDWHEFWTRDYWLEYLGRIGGRFGWWVQSLCLRAPQRAFCFAQMHARRLREAGLNGEVSVLEGEYAGGLERPHPQPAEPVVVFAARHIPEKRVTALVPAMSLLRETVPELRWEIYGDGPDRGELERRIAAEGLNDVASVHGFVPAEEVDAAMRRALCHVLPSRREGYGLVVIEAAARGTPSVVVADPDNAASELIEEGVNGYVAPSADAQDLAAAIARVRDGGAALRESTAAWFEHNARRLSLDASLETVAAGYSARS